jgi:hypothetical protein
MIAMMISAIFPNVAFRRPPIPSPVRAARCSVARPIQPAIGMIATPARKNTQTCASGARKRTAIAIGVSGRSQFSEGLRAFGIGP